MNASVIMSGAACPLLLLTAVSLGQSGDEGGQESLEDRIRHDRRSQIQSELMPRRIQAPRISEWADVLNIDEEDRLRLNDAQSIYASKFRSIDSEQGRLIRNLWASSWQWNEIDETWNPVYTPVLIELMEASSTAHGEIGEIEQAFFRSLESTIDPEKHPEFLQLKYERERELLHGRALLRGADLDLLQLVKRVNDEPDFLARLDPLPSRYRRQVIEAMRVRIGNRTRIQMDRTRLLVELGPRWRLGTPRDQQDRVDEQLADLDAEFIEQDQPLRWLNQEFLASIKKRLLPEQAARLQALYNQEVHPDLYEDRLRFDQLGRKILDKCMIVADREAITMILEETDRKLARLAESAVELEDSKMSATGSIDEVDRAIVEIMIDLKVLEIMIRRRETCERAIGSIRGVIVGYGQELHDEIEDFLRSSRAANNANRFKLERLHQLRQNLIMLPGDWDQEPLEEEDEQQRQEIDQ
ncbi:MAG: hypothetical protein CMJ32_09900 [Phycisphaerae bacterium]|nr:hypothetical protein [Phycisphaerae bacterium]